MGTHEELLLRAESHVSSYADSRRKTPRGIPGDLVRSDVLKESKGVVNHHVTERARLTDSPHHPGTRKVEVCRGCRAEVFRNPPKIVEGASGGVRRALCAVHAFLTLDTTNRGWEWMG